MTQKQIYALKTAMKAVRNSTSFNADKKRDLTDTLSELLQREVKQ